MSSFITNKTTSTTQSFEYRTDKCLPQKTIGRAQTLKECNLRKWVLVIVALGEIYIIINKLNVTNTERKQNESTCPVFLMRFIFSSDFLCNSFTNEIENTIS